MLVAAWYIAILLTVGATSAARACVVAPQWPRRLTRLALASATALVLVNLLRLWTQTRDAFGTDEPFVLEQVRIILFETNWGDGWLWQGGSAVVAWLVVLVWQARWPWWPIATAAATIAAFTTALNGHAVGMEEGVWVTVTAHGLHVAAAGWWIGGLTAILTVSMGVDVGRDVQQRQALSDVIDRFSPVALCAVALLVAAGGVATWQHLITPAGLAGFATPYGLALLTKIGIFAAAGLCGLYNWRVLRPQVGQSADAARQLRAMAWLEVSLGLMAIVLTAVLGTMSMPEPPGGH